MIDVFQEEVQRQDALRQAAFDRLPLCGGEDARHQVIGEDALGAMLLTIDGEGDALVQERKIGGLLPIAQLIIGQFGQPGIERVVMRRARDRRG